MFEEFFLNDVCECDESTYQVYLSSFVIRISPNVTVTHLTLSLFMNILMSAAVLFDVQCDIIYCT